MLTKEQKKEWKTRAKSLEPILRIGKNGLTPSVLEEIKKQLKKKKLVKLKMLTAYVEGKNKKETAKDIAEQTDSELIDLVGFVVVLAYKPKKRELPKEFPKHNNCDEEGCCE